jgi:hypothetical protein
VNAQINLDFSINDAANVSIIIEFFTKNICEFHDPVLIFVWFGFLHSAQRIFFAEKALSPNENGQLKNCPLVLASFKWIERFRLSAIP